MIKGVNVRVLYEPNDENDRRIDDHVVNCLKNAFRNTQDASVAVVVYDDEDKVLGTDTKNPLSEEMQKEYHELTRPTT